MRRLDERLVALHVDDDLARQVRGDFGDAIGAGAMSGLVIRRRRRRSHGAAMRASSVATTTASTARLRRAAIDVLDHRTAGDDPRAAFREVGSSRSGRG